MADTYSWRALLSTSRSASSRNEVTSACSRVASLTVPATTSARTTSPPKSAPASMFRVPGKAACRSSSVKKARLPPISCGAIVRSWSSTRVSIISLYACVHLFRAVSP